MDRWSIIRQVAAQAVEQYERQPGRVAFTEHQGSYAALKDLAERCFKLTITEDALAPNVEGELNDEEGSILVRRELTDTRRRLVIAHEIGHKALKHPPREIGPDQAKDIVEAPHFGGLTVRDSVYRAYNERDRLELEANVFAAELLAPVSLVRKKVLADPSWTVSGLAVYFGISRAAMLNQLTAALFCNPEQQEAPRQPPPLDKRGQREAAEAEAPALVLAGPGAGKTRVLVGRFEYLVSRGVEPRRILALTFGNKAAGEMRNRLVAQLPDHGTAIQVETYHSFGLNLLQAYGDRIGLRLPLQLRTPVDAFILLRNRLASLEMGSFEELHYPSRPLELLLKAFSRAKDELVGPEEFQGLASAWQAVAESEGEQQEAQRCVDAAEIYATYQQWLREEGYVDYGDLIAEAVRLFKDPEVAEKIRGEYDHILVDEFQDINYASGRLVKALDGGRGIVWAVGDPRQSIYGFRGASPVNLVQFTADHPGAQVIPLEWNYRSVEEVVRAGQAVPIPMTGALVTLPIPQLQSDRGRSGDSARVVELIEVPEEPDELRAVAERVASLLEMTSSEQIAVLCRKRSHAQAVADALERREIPTNWGGALAERRVFKHAVGMMLLAGDDLRGLVAVADIEEHRFAEGDLQRLLEAAKRHGNSPQAALYRAVDGEIEGFSEAARQQAEQLKRLVGILANQPTPWHTLAVYLFEHALWVKELVRTDGPAAQRSLATLGQVADLVREFNQRPHLVGSGDLKVFVEFLEAGLESGVMGEAGSTVAISGAVQVMTVHQSKGLEWSAVLVPYLADGRFPLRERPDKLPLPPGLRHGEEMNDHFTEEACLFYVAVTRARDRLVLTRAKKYGRNRAAASPFLEGLVTELTAAGYLQHVALPGGLADPETRSGHEGRTFPDGIPHAALKTYEDCPRRFLYEWKYRLTDPDRGYRDFHSVVYAVLTWAEEQVAQGQTLTAEGLRAVLDARWAEGGPKEHRLESLYRRRAERVVEQITSRFRPGVRFRFRQRATVQIGVHTVLVTPDEVEDGPEGRAVRRHRFGRRPKTFDDHPVLRVLDEVSLGDIAVGPVRVYVHYAMEGVDDEVSASAKTMSVLKKKNWREKVEKHLSAIQAGEFPPNPSDRECPYCRFNLICPGGTC